MVGSDALKLTWQKWKMLKLWRSARSFWKEMQFSRWINFFVLHKKQTQIFNVIAVSIAPFIPRKAAEKDEEQSGRWRWREKEIMFQKCNQFCDAWLHMWMHKNFPIFESCIAMASYGWRSTFDWWCRFWWNFFFFARDDASQIAVRPKGNGRDWTWNGSEQRRALACASRSWFFSIVKWLIIGALHVAASCFSLLARASHSSIRDTKRRKTQSAPATWSRYSCSLVIDIFDSSFSLLLLLVTHYIHIIFCTYIHYVQRWVFKWGSDKNQFPAISAL